MIFKLSTFWGWLQTLEELARNYISADLETESLVNFGISQLPDLQNLRVASCSVIDWKIGSHDYFLLLANDDEIVQSIKRQTFKYPTGNFSLENPLCSNPKIITYEELQPASSIPYCELYHEYFEFEDNHLTKILELAVETRDCGMGVDTGLFVSRKAVCIDKGFKIIEKTYTFPCENFEFEDPIEDLTLQKDSIFRIPNWTE